MPDSHRFNIFLNFDVMKYFNRFANLCKIFHITKFICAREGIEPSFHYRLVKSNHCSSSETLALFFNTLKPYNKVSILLWRSIVVFVSCNCKSLTFTSAKCFMEKACCRISVIQRKNWTSVVIHWGPNECSSHFI